MLVRNGKTNTCKRWWYQATLLSGCIAANVLPAQATTDEYARFVIPYERLQSEFVCLDEQTMNATFGIPLFSLLVGVFNPTMTLIGGAPSLTYDNINLLTMDGGITHQYIFDSVTPSNTWEYKLSIDLAAVDSSNGNSAAGRQKTINKAKLAIVSIVKTAETLHGAGNFRVWIKVDNLPSQSGLTGSPVLTMPLTTPSTGAMWPYTSTSPALQTYINETVSSGC